MSIEVSVEFKGLEELRTEFARAPTKLVQAGYTAMGEWAAFTMEKARELCPYVTGTLQRSIEFQMLGQFEAVVSATAFYAFWVEFGTRRFAGRFYMTGAAQTGEYFAQEIWTNVLKEVFP